MTVEALEINQEASSEAFWSIVEPLQEERVNDALEALYPYARQIASGLAKRYSLCTPDDITQEIVAYVWSKPKVWEEWQAFCLMEAEVDEEEAKHAANRMRLICRRAGERYCRRELAEQLGYRPEDEAFYSVGQLRLLVEWYYRDGLTERPTTGARQGERISSPGDPGTGGNWLTSLLDVQRGLAKMPRKYRARLRARWESWGQYTDTELAAMVANLATARGTRERIERLLGSTPTQIDGRVTYALGRLQRALGGPTPYRKYPIEDDR